MWNVEFENYFTWKLRNLQSHFRNLEFDLLQIRTASLGPGRAEDGEAAGEARGGLGGAGEPRQQARGERSRSPPGFRVSAVYKDSESEHRGSWAVKRDQKYMY